MSLSCAFLISSFKEFVTLNAQNNPNRDSIMQKLQQVNFDSLIVANYLSEPQPCLLQEIPLQTIQKVRMTDEKYMVACHSGLVGLCRAILLGMMMCDQQAQFIGNHPSHAIFNRFIVSMKGLEVSDVVAAVNTSQEMAFQIETFCSLSEQLLANNKSDEHLSHIFQQIDTLDGLTIEQVVQLLYLMQASINTDICTLVQIQKSPQEEPRVLKFNSTSNQVVTINILVVVSAEGLKFNLVVPPKRDLRRHLQSMLEEMNSSSLEIMDAYGLSSLQNSSHYVDVLCSQLRTKAFSLQQQSPQHQQTPIPSSSQDRECMMCRKQFMIDTSNFGSSISHFCERCKQTYLTNK